MADKTRNRSKRLIFIPSNILPVFIGLCFFLSGASGLVYELLWVRMIDKVIGSAPFAVATVLTVFMAGLAVGSFFISRVIDRFPSRASLLALYGKLELGIGACALAVPFVIQAGLPLYRIIYDRLLDQFLWYQAAAFAGCVLVLVVPAALMGATLPVLCRYYVLRTDHIGTRTGWLYGLNTAGAAIGVILCGFVLIQSLGVWVTLFIFTGINGFIGGACILMSRTAAAALNTQAQHRDEIKSDISTDSGHPHGALSWPLVIFAVSGFCSMAYEVLWTRLLGLIAGPTSFCFTIVVATFITGLALGSMFFGHLADKTRFPKHWLIITQMGAAVSAIAVSQMLGNSQFLFAKLIYTFRDQFTLLMTVQALLLFALLLPTTLFSGAAFPLVNKLCSARLDSIGRSLGTAYALNTLGSLMGSFVAGFVLIPFLGKAGGLRLVAMVQFALAFFWLLSLYWRARETRHIRLAAGAAMISGLVVMYQFPAWKTELLSRGWYRDFAAIEADLQRTGWVQALWQGTGRIAGLRQGLSVVFKGEGPAGFTTVEKEVTSLGNVEYAMFNSGKADASSHGDCSTQALSAHIPLLFHPHAENVMVLGLASGMTAGEVLLYPIQKLDIVEINSQVVEACDRFFGPWNNHCLDDPRTRMIIQDGRNHLALTRDTYDVIISEPSNPWMAGLANLYSLEFFELARQHLTENGLFAQWIQAYEMDWDTFSLLGRTFATAFPKSSMIKVGPVDYLLLGVKDSHRVLDWSVAEKNMVFACKSQTVDIPDAPDFLAHLFLNQDLPALFGPGRLHTDNHPYLEFAAPRMLYKKTLDIDRLAGGSKARLAPATLEMQRKDPLGALLDLVLFNASANVPMFSLLPLDRLTSDQQARYRQTVAAYCGRVLIPSYSIFNDPGLKAECAVVQVRSIQKQLARDDTRAMDHFNLGLGLIASGRNSEAAASLNRAITLDPGHEAAMTLLGLLLARTGNLDQAYARLAEAVRLAPGRADSHKYLGMVARRQGKTDVALAELKTALTLAPDDPVTLSELGAVCLQQGQYREAMVFLDQALKQNPNDAETRYYMELAQKKVSAGS